MKTTITKASDDDWTRVQEVSSLEDLLAIMEEFDEQVILTYGIFEDTKQPWLDVKVYD